MEAHPAKNSFLIQPALFLDDAMTDGLHYGQTSIGGDSQMEEGFGHFPKTVKMGRSLAGKPGSGSGSAGMAGLQPSLGRWLGLKAAGTADYK
jgi:hypothetical protein